MVIHRQKCGDSSKDQEHIGKSHAWKQRLSEEQRKEETDSDEDWHEVSLMQVIENDLESFERTQEDEKEKERKRVSKKEREKNREKEKE